MVTGVRRLSLLIVAAVTALPIAAINSVHPTLVHAAAGDGITAYISPPFVQGPPANTNATIEDFNSPSFCSSLGQQAVGTFSGDCTTISTNHSEFKFGGANTTSDQPTVGGTPTQFVAAWGDPSQELTLSFPDGSPAKYVGFWWSAGSAGNKVRFYSKVSGTEEMVAEFTTNPLNILLNTSGNDENSALPPNPYPGSQHVTAMNGTQYKKGYYFGRPSDHQSLTPALLPVAYNANNNIYSHAYLNVYSSGSIAFSKVVFIGGGFEFDNLAVSDQLRTPSPELVLLQSVLGKSVDFRANEGTGSMPAQTSTSAANLSPNTFTRDGFTFAGWSTSPTGSVEYQDGANFGFTSDLTLHAVWTENPSTPVPAPEEQSTPPTTTLATTPVASDTTSPVSIEVLTVNSLPKTGSSSIPMWLFAVSLITAGLITTRVRRRVIE